MSLQTPTAHLFNQWAEVYDLQTNPLLALETRWLPRIFPAIAGCDILDVGCGTGRWLAHFESLSPTSLTGCDLSPAMLARARDKLSPRTSLHQCTAYEVPAIRSSLDLMLASFVLSYLEDLPAFALECSRTLKPGGQIILSDMHPSTALRHGWRRGFRAGARAVDVPTCDRSLNQIITTFTSAGFHVAQLEAPAFAEPERCLFAQTGKLDDYAAFLGVPALYILRLQKQASPKVATFSTRSKTSTQPITQPETLRLKGANTAVDETRWSQQALTIRGGFISPGLASTATLDLTGYVVLPGLVNAHDHLEFALFPNLGRSSDQAPYRNATEWAQEIHQTHQAVVNQQLQVPLATRLWFGALRNLLCGATTVCHHNPLYPELSMPEFPVRVVQGFSWAHSLTFDERVSERFTASPPGRPFIIHAGEGTDHAARHELQQLNQLHLLTPDTVLVHALAFTRSDMDFLNACKASVILCPTSNHFLFRKMISAKTIQSLHHVALGSDSPLTSAGDLLDELHFLASQGGVSPSLLSAMVTSEAASILRLGQGEGAILSGSRADLIAVRCGGLQSPCEVVSTLTLENIELVLLAGRVHLASPSLYKELSLQSRAGMHRMEIVTSHSRVERWIKAPLPQLFASAEQVLGVGSVRLGNKEVRYLPTS